MKNNKNSYGVFCHSGKNYYMHIYIEKARLLPRCELQIFAFKNRDVY